ncbi:MAG: carboxypeptidase regulatory-like domain-containing protein, partial [Vulcanimicrobiaceae bacterium]
MVQTLNARAWHFALARIGAALIAIALVGAPLAPAYAAGGLTGNLTGTVIDAQTSAPLAGATIDAVAPTGTYTATTNARGFFAILGMNVDTYTVSIQAQGFEPISVSGVTIPGDGNLSLGTVSAHKQLQTIGIVRARSQSSVFQPKQTIDSYTIAGARIIQTTGKAFATNQNNLVLAVPGVTLSNAGNPTIRGGLRTEVGYQLDGIPFTEPFFSQNASNGTFNGLGSLQVVEGAGDATQSDVGGGVVNIVPQRGTNPPFGAVDAEIGGPNFSHQFGINYGFATANGRISDYFSYIGQRNVPYLGQRGLATAAYNNFYGVSYNSSDDFLNNFVVKFGHDNNQSLQVLYENRRLDQYGNAGGIVNSGPFASSFYPNDPANPFNQNNPATGPFALQNYNNLVGLTPGLP